MSTLGCGNWENSQTTWDYRKNHDLEVSHIPTLYPYQNIAPGMASRYHNPRRTLHDISVPQLPEKRYSVGHITTNNIVVNPNGNGYVTATIRRNNLFQQAIELPTVMTLNSRSIYNKTEEFSLLLEQYNVDVCTISESWERDNLSLIKLLNLDDYQILSNVKQRDFKGEKPAILVKSEKYNVKALCPDIITVSVGVEAVWALNLRKLETLETQLSI